tara:strand:- start:1644 stop:1994 length:351 start_codon:yes stop_codon:yes gene_type:complete
MNILQVSLTLMLFLVFTIGGTFRLFQPIDVLAKRMLWVKYFNPRIVRSIALLEVICGIGIILPFLLIDSTFPFLICSGCLLMLTMLGAAVTHAIIGDYKQIMFNLFLLGILYWVTF